MLVEKTKTVTEMEEVCDICQAAMFGPDENGLIIQKGYVDRTKNTAVCHDCIVANCK